MVLRRCSSLVRAQHLRTRALCRSAFTQVEHGFPVFTTGPIGAPAVIVIQEWWGVNDGILSIAKRISDAGPYRVLVPDIYKGAVGVDAEEAHHLCVNSHRQPWKPCHEPCHEPLDAMT